MSLMKTSFNFILILIIQCFMLIKANKNKSINRIKHFKNENFPLEVKFRSFEVENVLAKKNETNETQDIESVESNS